MIDAHTHCFPDALAPRALSKTDLYEAHKAFSAFCK